MKQYKLIFGTEETDIHFVWFNRMIGCDIHDKTQLSLIENIFIQNMKICLSEILRESSVSDL